MNCKNGVFSRPDKIKDTQLERFYWVNVSKVLAKIDVWVAYRVKYGLSLSYGVR